MKKTKSGFTIVELLIVIVVIGILAAITIVAYNGIQERARASAASAALNQAGKKILVAMNDGTLSTYPATQAAFDALNIESGDIDYQYKATTNGYCITATTGTTSYMMTESATPTKGGCAGHGVGGVQAITNLATNPSVETNAANYQNPFGGGSPNNTLTRDTTRFYHGTASARFGRGTAFADNRMARYLVSGHSTGTYTLTAWVYVNDAAINTISLYFEFCGSTGTSGAATNTGGAIGEWRRISGTYTVATAGNLCVNLHGGTNQIGSINVDALMITSGSTQHTYADGSFANWAWNGTANNATSTGPPL